MLADIAPILDVGYLPHLIGGEDALHVLEQFPCEISQLVVGRVLIVVKSKVQWREFNAVAATGGIGDSQHKFLGMLHRGGRVGAFDFLLVIGVLIGHRVALIKIGNDMNRSILLIIIVIEVESLSACR